MVRQPRPRWALTMLYDDVSHLRSDFCSATKLHFCRAICSKGDSTDYSTSDLQPKHERLVTKAASFQSRMGSFQSEINIFSSNCCDGRLVTAAMEGCPLTPPCVKVLRLSGVQVLKQLLHAWRFSGAQERAATEGCPHLLQASPKT